ncbi:hypothetical protein [Candidatus Pantoea bituminis]|uniref:hypothetical protein n=1 Tax=Candidatus Pantoea bituminis TaxID=2831036 RepID=UPI001C060301|nr:hypothetical protein [Pantoea bituminis]
MMIVSASPLRQKGAKIGFCGAAVQKYSFKNSYPEDCLASCTGFGHFTLTIACAFAKTVSEAKNVNRIKTGFNASFCAQHRIKAA